MEVWVTTSCTENHSGRPILSDFVVGCGGPPGAPQDSGLWSIDEQYNFCKVKKAWLSPQTSKSQLFATWKEKQGNWLEVCYEVGLMIRSSDSVSTQYKFKTRAMMLETLDSITVDDIIAEKTGLGHWCPHPDAPHKQVFVASTPRLGISPRAKKQLKS